MFAGGCTLEAARVVCDSAIEGLVALIDDNLVVASVADGGSRYWMLETVREYATQQLETAGEREEIGARHHKYFLELAERCNLFAEAELPQNFDTANSEQDNLRAAIGWPRERGQDGAALRLTVALENFWVTHDPEEGVRLLADLTAPERDLTHELRARGLRALGSSRQALGQLEEAERHYHQSRAAFTALDDDKAIAILDYRLGLTAAERGNTDTASRLLERSLDVFRAIGSRRGEAQATGALGTVARARGDRPAAARLFRQSAAMCEQIGRPWWQALMLAEAGELALEDGNLDASATYATRLLKLATHIGDRRRTILGLLQIACAAARGGEIERAQRICAVLNGESSGLADSIASARYAEHVAAMLVRARPELPSSRRQGSALTLEDAIDAALATATN